MTENYRCQGTQVHRKRPIVAHRQTLGLVGIRLPVGYLDALEKQIKDLWMTTHRNKPLSIAVKIGCDAAFVRQTMGLPDLRMPDGVGEFEEDFDG